MSDINIQMQDSTGNNVYPQTKAKIVKIGSTDAETMLNELEGREEVFVEVTEPTKDGLWIDTSDSEYGGSESQLATQVKTYVDGKLDPVINEVQTARNGETVLDDRLDKIDNVEVYGSEITTSNEINDINVDVPKQMKVNVSGKTFNNIFGNDGNCEDLSRYIVQASGTASLDSSNKVFGNNGIKVTNASNASWGGIYKDVSGIIDTTKYYCFSAYLKNGNCLGGINVLTANSSSAQISGSTPITATDKFYRSFIKLKPSDLTNVKYMGVSTSNNSVSSAVYAYADGLMLEEITQAQYNDANFQPSPFIDADVSVGEIPCKIKTRGKNLIDLVQGSFFTNGTIFSSFGTQITRMTHKDGIVNVKPNTTYTFSSDKAISYVIHEFNESKNMLDGNAWQTATTSATFTTGVNTRYVGMAFKIDETTTVYADDYKIQLEEGSTATTYEPYRETYINADKALRSLPNGVKDEIINNKLIQRVGKVILDGTLNWKFMDSFTGYKRVWCGFTTSDVLKSTVTNGYGMFYGLKYNGKSLGSRINAEAIGQDQAYIDYGYNGVFVTIPSSDSGWGDSYTPTTDEIKAYFNGYKMIVRDTTTIYNGTGNKGWRNIGQADSNIGCRYDVLACSAINNSYGYIPYRAYYQLATPIVTELNLPNLMAYPSGDLVIESAYQSFIRPIINYTLIDSTKANINKLEDGLNNSKRQFMSYIGANDKSVAQIANPNILLNGDFRNPINQRGSTVYNTNAYSIDRWVLSTGISLSVFNEVSAKGIRLATTSASSSCGIMQLLEYPTLYSGKTVTLTVKYRTTSQFAKVYLHSREVGNFGNIQFKYHDNEWHTETITAIVPKLSSDTTWLEIGIQFWNQGQNYAVGETMDVEWIKLEFGALSTPFIPRSYGDELALCKRYFQFFQFTGVAYATNLLPIYRNFQVAMRVPPSIAVSTSYYGTDGTIDAFGTGAISIAGYSIIGITSEFLQYIYNSTQNNFTVGRSYDGYMRMDAELY